MPEFLNFWLRSLTDENAAALWQYLDGDPDAIDAMVTTIVGSHPAVMAAHMAEHTAK